MKLNGVLACDGALMAWKDKDGALCLRLNHKDGAVEYRWHPQVETANEANELGRFFLEWFQDRP